MTNHEKARILIRLARKCPEESNILLSWAEELLQEPENEQPVMGTRRRRSTPNTSIAASRSDDLRFPLSIFILARGRRIDGILYSDERVEVNGRPYNSPSDAATTELGYSENGWRKWMYEEPDGTKRPIDALRRRGLIGSPVVRRRRRPTPRTSPGAPGGKHPSPRGR